MGLHHQKLTARYVKMEEGDDDLIEVSLGDYHSYPHPDPFYRLYKMIRTRYEIIDLNTRNSVKLTESALTSVIEVACILSTSNEHTALGEKLMSAVVSLKGSLSSINVVRQTTHPVPDTVN
jgi:hypothetical protein